MAVMLRTGFELQIAVEVSLNTQQRADGKRQTANGTQDTAHRKREQGCRYHTPTARYIDEWIVYKTWCEAPGVKIIHNFK